LLGCINARRQRLTLGAVRTTSGELVFFDSASTVLSTEHAMASGAMPPNFPGVRVGNELIGAMLHRRTTVRGRRA
jgi:NTE family protein